MFPALWDIISKAGPFGVTALALWLLIAERKERKELYISLLNLTKETVSLSEQWLRVLDKSGRKNGGGGGGGG